MQFRLVPDNTRVRFVRWRFPAMLLSAVLMLASIGGLFYPGLNFGIDFRGGILLEVRTPGPADLGSMRTNLNQLGLGEVALQEFGAETDVLIRIARQEGDEQAQQAAVVAVQNALDELIGEGISYRRTELVGPKVSEELLQAGIMATVLAMVAVLVYIWFRFEWQYGVGAVFALVHDVVLTLGLFALLQLEVNLTTVAAVLTIVGYSLNDTVVIFDRVRENLRRYRTMAIPELLDVSMNETLARTLMTSLTTLLALVSLYMFGGEVIRGFTLAMIWGVIIGTYSTIYVSTPTLIYLNLRSIGAKAEAREEIGNEVVPAVEGPVPPPPPAPPTPPTRPAAPRSPGRRAGRRSGASG
jgi:preprotein translocase subunit SecF